MRTILLVCILGISLSCNKKTHLTADKVKCAFPSSLDLFMIPDCAIKNKDGVIKIIPNILEKLKFNTDGLVSGTIGKYGCYWVNTAGLVRKSHCFDNGADYFKEGLSRHIGAAGKFGFMNKQLSIVIKPQFDFVFPFNGNFSTVCKGCKSTKSSDHSSMRGGSWSIINKLGVVVKNCQKARVVHECQQNFN